jgi:fibronectin type 3 domain-containing protein
MKKIIYILLLITILMNVMIVVSKAASLPAPSYVNAFVYGTGSIRINWDNEVQGASGFTIQKKTDTGEFTTIARVSSSVSTYNDTRVSNGHTYTYRVFATSGTLFGYSADSYPVEYLHPTTLSINALSDSELELSWSYPVSNRIPESNYQTVIERRLDGATTWQTIANIPGNQNTYIDNGLSEGTRYFYRIRAVTATSAAYMYYPDNNVGRYAYTLLKAPTNVQAKIMSTSAIKITWQDNSSKETGYRIERKTGTGSFRYLTSVKENETSYIDGSPVNGEQYTYRIVPISKTYSGMPSEEVTVPFLFPVSFRITDIYSTQMTLTWGYPGSSYIRADNSRVIIERREAGDTTWEQIHITRPGETEYTDDGLTPGTRYYYRIRSRYDDDFTTEYFPSASGISDYTKLILDTHFYGYALSDSEILLMWDESAVGSSTIVIEKIGDSGSYEPFVTLSKTGSYIDTVKPGSLNTYRMKIRSQNIESDYTAEIDVTAETLPTVKKLTVRSVTPERVFITWEYDAAVESGFEIWRRAQSEGIWRHVATIERGKYMYSDENIINGETYSYMVRAVKVNTTFSPFTLPVYIRVSFTEPDGVLVISRDGKYIYLGWDDFSDYERHYIVEYKTTVYGAWQILDTLYKNTTLYRFIPDPGVDYTIRVRAYSEYPIYEACTNEVFYSTRLPAIPSLSYPTIIGSNRVVLNWVDMSDNEDEFVIYRKSYGNQFAAIGSADENTTVFVDDSVLPGREYTYIVKSKNAAGESFKSNEITVETPLKTLFNDIESHPWAKNAIEALASMGVIEGDGKGNFNPYGDISRAEFIKLLVASFSFPETPLGSFRDVTPNDWHHRWIMTAYRRGIIEPDENRKFYPDTPITRQDIVYYSSRAMRAADLSLDQPPLYILYEFDDFRDIAPYAQSAFAAMKYAGIINGIGDNKLGPSATATRAEAATIIYRMLQALDSNRPVTSDNQTDK